MRILAFMIITGVILLFLTIAISFGVAMGIILGYETLKRKGGENDTKSNESAEG